MAKETVEVLVDDLDGSAAAETVRLGWNGEWRELELSTRNVAALSRAVKRYWDVARPAGADGPAARPRKRSAARSRRSRDPKAIRAWATANGVNVPTRGRIPRDVERQFNEANAS